VRYTGSGHVMLHSSRRRGPARQREAAGHRVWRPPCRRSYRQRGPSRGPTHSGRSIRAGQPRMCPSTGRLHEALKPDLQTARYAIQRTEGRGTTLRTLRIGSLLRKSRDRYNLGRASRWEDRSPDRITWRSKQLKIRYQPWKSSTSLPIRCRSSGPIQPASSR
jgi:hypothetical protein